MSDTHQQPDPAPTPETEQEPAEAGARRRLGTLTVLGVVAVLAVALAAVALPARDDPPPPDIPVDAWVPYWALDAATSDLARRAPSLREVSPFWYSASGVTTIRPDPNTPMDLADEFLRTARRLGVTVVPAIVDALPAGGMAAILADPAQRSAHVDTIVALATRGDYGGIDIDYEQFAFADGRETWATTRPNWVAFITELAERLHADGRTLTVSIPPVYDTGRTEASGYWVYDYAAIAPVVDRIRVMAYDYSTAAPGPIAPLPWVERVIDGTIAASGTPEKLVLGIPLYGYNWPAGTVGSCPDDELVGRTAVTIRSVGELISLRDAVPVYDERLAEWAFVYDLEVETSPDEGDDEIPEPCVQARRVHFVDAEGARERIDLARRSGMGGVALWAFGYDDQSLWDAIEPLLRPPVTAPDG